MLGRNDLHWKGDKLYRSGSTRPLIGIEPDPIYPAMWRIRLHDGSPSDIVNKTRAREAAMSIALANLNGREIAREARTGALERRAA